MRDIIIAGNWKMNKGLDECRAFCSALKGYMLSHKHPKVKIMIAPAYPFLGLALDLLNGTGAWVSAQDVSTHNDGAYTGEVSATMLSSLGMAYCIVGHSERRQYHAESNAIVNQKLKQLLACGIVPVFCLGETLEQREAGQTEEVVLSQLKEGLAEIAIPEPQDMIIAYEPVWAIGTGRNASAEQAQEVHKAIRNFLRVTYPHVAEELCILYGGSMKPENIASLISMPDIDGGLIGGASLIPDSFFAMADAAINQAQQTE